MIRAVIDLHAHILPALDDGPANMGVSVAMAAAAVEAGTRTLAATSHVNRGFALEPDELREARERVRERLAADGIPLDVVQGGEIALSRAPDLDEADLRALTLGGSRCLLLECPLSPIAPSMEPMVAQLRGAGFEVLLAHPERAPTMIRSPGALDRLIALGATGQVTSGSLAGAFGEPVRKAAFAMIERGHVHVLASDGHHPSQRPPDLRPALEPLRRRYDGDGEALFEWMATGVPAALLADAALPPRPDVRRPRGGALRRFKA
jgi:protein-tyrosine phosphatase